MWHYNSRRLLFSCAKLMSCCLCTVISLKAHWKRKKGLLFEGLISGKTKTKLGMSGKPNYCRTYEPLFFLHFSQLMQTISNSRFCFTVLLKLLFMTEFWAQKILFCCPPRLTLHEFLACVNTSQTRLVPHP